MHCGAGIGRATVARFVQEGARVVVNDFGVSADGQGRDESAGRGVVDEIKAFGATPSRISATWRTGTTRRA